MKAKCLSAEGCTLTEGKVYEILRESMYYFHLIDDNGDQGGFFKNRFQLVEDNPRDFLKITSSFDDNILKPKMAVRFRFRDGQYINAIIRLVTSDMLYLTTVDNHNLPIPYELPRRYFEEGTIDYFGVIGE